MRDDDRLTRIENTLFLLNYRWNLEAYSLWKGDRPPFAPYRIYQGYEDFLGLGTLEILDRISPLRDSGRLKHALIDHYLRRALLPHESEMNTWMRGAAAHVGGRKIYLRDIIPWCQKQSTVAERRILQKETGPLCKFLRPFAVNYWDILVTILNRELGFENYIAYCRDKKGLDYAYYRGLFQDLLEQTDALYFEAMGRWTREIYGRPLEGLTRFDAINLLGLGYLDDLYPRRPVEDLLPFFRGWDMDPRGLPGLNLELGREQGKSPQAICFPLQIPEEVYVLMKPEGGWIDLETLWHELGHGLSAVFTSPELSMAERELGTTVVLSECYAFLLQNLCLSRPFLLDVLGLEADAAKKLHTLRVLKELSVFRRYAAKFLAEYEMFSSGSFFAGETYAGMMLRYTGFYHQAESHLFDLVPEFYSLEYLLALMGASVLEQNLEETLGPGWCRRPEAGEILRSWWRDGNRYDIFKFLTIHHLGKLETRMLLDRWRDVLEKGVGHGC